MRSAIDDESRGNVGAGMEEEDVLRKMSDRDEFPFPHHAFGQPAATRFRFASADAATTPMPDQHADLGAQFRSGQLREIMLVHGTFAGNDSAGWIRRVARFSPRVSALLKDLAKHWFDQLADEVGNYTDDYADRMSETLGRDPSPIPVHRFCWSGENHHLGRACGALALMESIVARKWSPQDRVMFLAHSHGGNLLAMWSLLLGGSEVSKRAFLRATHAHYPAVKTEEAMDRWSGTRAALLSPDFASTLPAMDVVTFGTPLRYRWNLDQIGKLLHFVHHRPTIDGQPARAAMPTSPADVIEAKGGDYVQHLGIAGTDFPHPFYAWRSRRDERRLQRLFEPRVRRRDLLRHLKEGRRVSLDGNSLLVNYGPPDEPLRGKLFGHGVYTCSPWMSFHLQEIAREFFDVGDRSCKPY